MGRLQNALAWLEAEAEAVDINTLQRYEPPFEIREGEKVIGELDEDQKILFAMGSKADLEAHALQLEALLGHMRNKSNLGEAVEALTKARSNEAASLKFQSEAIFSLLWASVRMRLGWPDANIALRRGYLIVDSGEKKGRDKELEDLVEKFLG